jgi:hypothetical protein
MISDELAIRQRNFVEKHCTKPEVWRAFAMPIIAWANVCRGRGRKICFRPVVSSRSYLAILIYSQ